MQTDAPLAASASEDQFQTGKLYAWLMFVMLFALGLLDFGVRQMIVALFPDLKAQWTLTDQQLGALSSIVPVAVSLAAVPVALMADRWGRVRAIATMATVWSLATLACGMARSYEELLVARAVLGMGEAGYGPAGFALLASLFPSRLRGTVIGGALVASALGSTLGVVAGGWAAAHWPWQHVMLAAGVVSLIPSVLFFAIRDRDLELRRSAAAVTVASRPTPNFREALGQLLATPTALLAYLAGAAQLFVFSTVIVWLPSYFNRSYGVAPDKAAGMAGAAILAACVGTVIWANLSDRMGACRPAGRLLVPAVLTLVTACTFGAAFGLLSPGPLQLALILVGACTVACVNGPVNAVVMDVVHPDLRATSAAFVAVFQNLFGLAAGPLIVGALSDAYGLTFALTAAAGFSVVACVALLVASTTYGRDRVLHTRPIAAAPSV